MHAMIVLVFATITSVAQASGAVPFAYDALASLIASSTSGNPNADDSSSTAYDRAGIRTSHFTSKCSSARQPDQAGLVRASERGAGSAA